MSRAKRNYHSGHQIPPDQKKAHEQLLNAQRVYDAHLFLRACDDLKKFSRPKIVDLHNLLEEIVKKNWLHANALFPVTRITPITRQEHKTILDLFSKTLFSGDREGVDFFKKTKLFQGREDSVFVSNARFLMKSLSYTAADPEKDNAQMKGWLVYGWSPKETPKYFLHDLLRVGLSESSSYILGTMPREDALEKILDLPVFDSDWSDQRFNKALNKVLTDFYAQHPDFFEEQIGLLHEKDGLGHWRDFLKAPACVLAKNRLDIMSSALSSAQNSTISSSLRRKI